MGTHILMDITSIQFPPNSIEAKMDVDGQIAPYGSCGIIPGVAYTYPGITVPYDELVFTTNPDPLVYCRQLFM